MPSRDSINSTIWREEPEPDNPFAASRCYCHGYDVYGDILGKAGWIEYLHLLLSGERPTGAQRKLLEDLAVAIANPGPRDHAVLAAMNGGVGGSNNAACLMAALAIGAGQLGGAREVALSMEIWQACGTDLEAWRRHIESPVSSERADVWPKMEHPPGFDPYGASCATPVRKTLEHLVTLSPDGSLSWLFTRRAALEEITDCPLAMTGVAAAAFHDLGFTPPQGEMLFLILRLPGAAAHALEQNGYGFRRFPFFHDAVHLIDDPGPWQAGKREEDRE